MESGLYFHIPFCRSRCSYCHFTSSRFDDSSANRYKSAVLREIETYTAIDLERTAIDSIYFGGGTPSIVPSDHILDILLACRRKFRILEGCEVSLEANPDTVSRENVRAYRQGGITRISLGAQSFSNRELRAVGRIHSAEMIHNALRHLKGSGFENINVDLMLGLPFQTRESWKNSMEKTMDLGVKHVSVYMLDLNEDCALSNMVQEGIVPVPEDDLISDLYFETIEFLSCCGFRQYEISNFALPDSACRHNLKYWRREPVFGFGLGSHSFDGNARWANTPEMDIYLDAVEGDRSPRLWQEVVDENHAIQESLFLGLRLTEGVDWRHLRDRFGEEKLEKYNTAMQEWQRKGYAKTGGGITRLTAEGMMISNEIFQQFV